MIHIATVHWRSDRWIDIQLRYLERNLDQPYRVYAWIDEGMRGQASKFFYATDVAVDRHELKLTLLGDLVAHAAADDDEIMFIDGDAFPIAPIGPFLRDKLERYPAGGGPTGREQRRSSASSVLLRHDRRVLAWPARRLAPWAHLDQSAGQAGDRRRRQPARAASSSAGIEWYPMLRTNRVNPHPLQFGVYEDLVYHHGGGFRLTAGGRLWRASVEDKLNSTLRGRLASRLPADGIGGRIRKRIDPLRRYRRTLGAELARVNEQVFELIQRDDEFYRQLIEPECGGELTELRAPVLLEDAEQLSATR